MRSTVLEHVRRLRKSTPLVHCFANYVSMDLMANVLLAGGASPAMIHAIEECAQFTGISSALVVNIGTLDAAWVISMKASVAAANSKGVPWILDLVGCGATTYRNDVCRDLALMSPTVIRGNASEIMALASALGVSEGSGGGRGVDSTDSSATAISAAAAVADQCKCVVGVSGQVDYVVCPSSGESSRLVLACGNGSALCTKVTAAGCAMTALIAAMLTVRASSSFEDTARATAAGFAYFGLASQRACTDGSGPTLASCTTLSIGPATLRTRLLDELHLMGEALLTDDKPAGDFDVTVHA